MLFWTYPGNTTQQKSHLLPLITHLTKQPSISRILGTAGEISPNSLSTLKDGCNSVGRPERTYIKFVGIMYAVLNLSIRVASIDEHKNSHRNITMNHPQTTYINRIALRAGKKGARPAEVWALASGFEKLVTELKKTKTTKMQTIQIATFNFRTLHRIGQLPELTNTAAVWGYGV